MRVLIDRVTSGAADAPLESLYAVPRTPWLRANMVSTLDGAATGASGKTGSINNAADHRVFHLLRELADVVLVGSGTARAEGYGPTTRPIVLVGKSGPLPDGLVDAPEGSVLFATVASAPTLASARRALGAGQVLVVGEDRVDPVVLKAELVARGFANVLCEGGPRLLADLLDAGVVDELCATYVPTLVGGAHSRILNGPPVDVPLDLRLLLEQDGTLLGRWFT